MDPFSIIMSVLGMGNQFNKTQETKRLAQERRDFGRNQIFESRIDKEALGKRPMMEIPQAQKDYVNLMKLRTRQGMPGEDALLAEQRQAGATTRGAAANLSGADAAAVLLGESQQRLRGLRAIGLEAARYGERQNLNYANAVQSMAPWQQEMWQQNQLYPWEIGMNEAQGKANMGYQMYFGGADQMQAASNIGASMTNQWLHQGQMSPNPWWGQQQAQAQAQPVYGGNPAWNTQMIPQDYWNETQTKIPLTPTFLPGVTKYPQ